MLSQRDNLGEKINLNEFSTRFFYIILVPNTHFQEAQAWQDNEGNTFP